MYLKRSLYRKCPLGKVKNTKVKLIEMFVIHDRNGILILFPSDFKETCGLPPFAFFDIFKTYYRVLCILSFLEYIQSSKQNKKTF